MKWLCCPLLPTESSPPPPPHAHTPPLWRLSYRPHGRSSTWEGSAAEAAVNYFVFCVLKPTTLFGSPGPHSGATQGAGLTLVPLKSVFWSQGTFLPGHWSGISKALDAVLCFSNSSCSHEGSSAPCPAPETRPPLPLPMHRRCWIFCTASIFIPVVSLPATGQGDAPRMTKRMAMILIESKQ